MSYVAFNIITQDKEKPMDNYTPISKMNDDGKKRILQFVFDNFCPPEMSDEELFFALNIMVERSENSQFLPKELTEKLK